jgi:hypothetical protein
MLTAYRGRWDVARPGARRERRTDCLVAFALARAAGVLVVCLLFVAHLVRRRVEQRRSLQRNKGKAAHAVPLRVPRLPLRVPLRVPSEYPVSTPMRALRVLSSAERTPNTHCSPKARRKCQPDSPGADVGAVSPGADVGKSRRRCGRHGPTGLPVSSAIFLRPKRSRSTPCGNKAK